MGHTINHTKTTLIKIPVKNQKINPSRDITAIFSSKSWSGRRCFVLGGGLSFEGFDFSKIQNELTIGVNKSFINFLTTINYAMDTRFYDSVSSAGKTPDSIELQEHWKNYKGIKIFLRRDKKFRFDSSIITVNSLPNKVLSLDLSKGIWGGNNSAFGALMLSIALGCKTIGLLGCDFYIDKERKKTHWHSGYKNQDIKSFPRKLESFKKCFEEFAFCIEKQGIKVVNLSEKSRLNHFSKMTLDEFLALPV